MLAKALGFEPDVLVPDMEDSVTDAEKPAARRLIGEWLPRLSAHTAKLMPRINALGTQWFDEDVRTAVAPGVWGLSIGKVQTPADIDAIAAAMTAAESAAGIRTGSLRLVPWIETALAVEHCFAICTASQRIAAIAYGGEDYTHDLGIERRDDEANTLYARSAICNAARAAGIQALETPYFAFRDSDGLQQNCLASKRIGFKGRFAIHPGQIDTINRCYAPSAEEIAEAERVIAAFAEAEQRGRGSTSLDGRVIDVPVVKRARALLAMTTGPGKRVP
jgi:citrate lyase subunit beta/citryl-CoA lyase